MSVIVLVTGRRRAVPRLQQRGPTDNFKGFLWDFVRQRDGKATALSDLGDGDHAAGGSALALCWPAG